MPVSTPSEAKPQSEWGDRARTILPLDAEGAARRIAAAGILPVLTRGQATPPSSPAPVEGDIHLLASGQLAYRTAAGAWQNHTPASDYAWQVSVRSEGGRVYQWSGSAWAPVDATAAAAAQSAASAAAAAQSTANAALPSASFAYEHSQASPSTTWTINHNLGRRPSIELRTLGGAEFEADIVHVSVNQAVITCAPAVAGVARCI